MININQDAAVLNKQFPNVPISKIVEFLTGLTKQYPQLNDVQIVDLLKTVFTQMQNKGQPSQQPQQQPMQSIVNQVTPTQGVR